MFTNPDIGKIRFVTLTVSCVGGDGGLDRQIPYADLCKEVRKFVNRILETCTDGS